MISEAKIPMTVPVSMDNVRLNEDTMEMEMSFYIDAKNQENPPKPNNPALYISTRPEMTVYTRYLPSKLFSRKIIIAQCGNFVIFLPHSDFT